MESARPARGHDLATVVELAGQFVAEQHALRGGVVWAAKQAQRLHPDALEVALQEAQREGAAHICLLGCLDDEPVGLLMATVDHVDPIGSVATIHVLYVQPEAREVGVGSVMLDAVFEVAALRGCVGVDATVLPGSRGAKNFFEMHGMVARAISVYRPVGDTK